MLYMDYNVPREKMLTNPEGRYDAFYDSMWFQDPVIVRIVEEVDGVKHVHDDNFEHTIFGRCSGMNLSHGVKTPILTYLGETGGYVLPLSWLGKNCFSVLGSFTCGADVTYSGNYVPQIEEWGCTFKSVRTGEIITGYDSYIKDYAKYVL